MITAEQRLGLIERQRRYAWELAQAECHRRAADLVAGKTHDLLNLVQIVQLAAPELSGRSDAFGEELIADIARAARDAYAQLDDLLKLARPTCSRTRGAPVAPALARICGGLAHHIHLACDVAAELVTALDESALEHLVICLALDPAHEEALHVAVRARSLDGIPWLELLCASTASNPEPRTHDDFDRRLVEAIVSHAGGELACNQRRDGVSELIVALPIVV